MADARVTRWTFGRAEVLRVPYFDIALPPEGVALTATAIDASGMAGPPWTDDAGNPVVGQAFWVVRSGERTIVVDPLSAADPFLRTGDAAADHQEAAFAALSAAGVERADVDLLVLTHLDGIGMAAWREPDGSWSPAFPNARYVVTPAERAFIATGLDSAMGAEQFEQFAAAGLVDEVEPPAELAPDVRWEATAGHSDGHAMVVVGGEEGPRAILHGHLTLSPIHLADTPDSLHVDPARAAAWTEEVVAASAERGDVLMGALWPTPGAARVTSVDPLAAEPVWSDGSDG